MNWVRLAAEIVRGAIGARETRPPATQQYIPRDGTHIVDLIQEYRAQVDRGLSSLAQEIRAEHERQQRALQIQRRWNYGLLAAVAILAVLLVMLLLRR